MQAKPSFFQSIKNWVIGGARDPSDSHIFQKLSLIAFFAWVGLGADGLSSSCYGPQEAFLALGGHTALSIFVALATVITIFVISSSYSQIVELFPAGGGGYLVASKLLSPTVGMVSGCALLIDYVLTITVSIASGADAVFSLLPLQFYHYKLVFAIFAVVMMTLLNMRGTKESILPLVPVFLIFLLTHAFIIIYAISIHTSNFPQLVATTKTDMQSSISQLGFLGMMFLIMRAYSMGAGTYTGIEAVSNGMPVLREPRVHTAKITMRYMAFSLAFVALGLMLGYLFYGVASQPGKTFNAILFAQATAGWGGNAYVFVLIALVSEALLLLVAAQTGFLDGPRVLSNMANDRWFPTRFSSLSDRLVVQNGILMMGGLAVVLMLLTRGSVRFLVVLYSINVFITFILSQAGMVRHWWIYRSTVRGWLRKLTINGIGLILCVLILATMIFFKFFEGGWITLLITGALVVLALGIKRHYFNTLTLLRRLNNLVVAAESFETSAVVDLTEKSRFSGKVDHNDKTAVLFVSGFNGIGLHTLFGVIRLFGGVFKNFVFVQVGIIDAANFKGSQEVDRLQASVKFELDHYVKFMNKQGFYAEGISAIGVDVVSEAEQIATSILERFPSAVFFGGQLIFPKESLFVRLLHNYTVFSLQRRLYPRGIPFVILPIRV